MMHLYVWCRLHYAVWQRRRRTQTGRFYGKTDVVKGHCHSFFIGWPIQEGYMRGWWWHWSYMSGISGENLVTPLISLFGNTLDLMVIALCQVGKWESGKGNGNGNGEYPSERSLWKWVRCKKVNGCKGATWATIPRIPMAMATARITPQRESWETQEGQGVRRCQAGEDNGNNIGQQLPQCQCQCMATIETMATMPMCGRRHAAIV